MIDINKRFEDMTVQIDLRSKNVIHKTSELKRLDWNELEDNDLVEVSHKTTDGIEWESCAISFKDLCRAIKTALALDGAIPMQGED